MPNMVDADAFLLALFSFYDHYVILCIAVECSYDGHSVLYVMNCSSLIQAKIGYLIELSFS